MNLDHTLHNKTKIIATVGPATSDIDMLKKLILAGADVVRINFSHGSHDVHAKIVQNVRTINKELSLNIAILGDLQGPKLRIGEMEENTVIQDGQEILVTTEDCVGNANKLYVSYEHMPLSVEIGHPILIDDGNITMEVIEKIDAKTIKARVLNGGPVTSNKGFNLPQTHISLPSLTDKDLSDLEFAIAHQFDWIGLSFVRTGEDVADLRRRINDLQGAARIIAKIEKPEAVANIKVIVKSADAIMVARGDLGVELPLEQVPMIQKKIVERCINWSKPVIIATQMMESMISNARPTRAEASDVANAVMDGADAVMLSAETSVGKYPVEAVRAVARIVRSTEEGWDIYHIGKKPSRKSRTFLSDQICYAAVQISEQIKAKAIISMTQSGYTAFKIASYRPKCHVFIFTSNRAIFRILNLVWNVRVFYYDKMESTDQTITDVMNILKENGLVHVNDLVVHTASMPIMSKSRTNALKISRVDG